MTIPGFQELMGPVLEEVGRRGECSTSDLVDAMAERFGLSAEERTALLPGGRQTVIANRTYWAIVQLGRQKRLERTQPGYYQLTGKGTPDGPELGGEKQATPHEVIRTALREIENALHAEVIDRVLKRDAKFFERMLVDALLAAGYGAGDRDAVRMVGGAGDDGVDIVVHQDALGLDLICVQAKRYDRARAVGPDAVRALAGSLGIYKASKGLLVTTSSFTAAAQEAAKKVAGRIVLIDGDELARLMIRHEVGVRVEETFHVKKVDGDFFLGRGGCVLLPSCLSS